MNNYEELDLDIKVDSDSKVEALDSEDSIIITDSIACRFTVGYSRCYC